MRLALALALLLLVAPGALALESAPAATGRTSVTLVSEVDVAAPGRPFRVALRQKLAPGWHTYWLNSGDAGEPPQLAFELPDGASASPLRFPAPHRIPVGPLVNFGYETEAVFTATITPAATSDRTFPLVAKATWLVCEKICIPEEATFRLSLPVEPSARPAVAAGPLFAAAEADQPRPSPWPARLVVADGTARLELTGEDLRRESLREAFFFPAQWGLIDNAAPQLLSVDNNTLTLALKRGDGAVPATVEGVIAIVDGAGIRSAYEIGAAPGGTGSASAKTASTPVAATASAPIAAQPLWLIALWAVLGGLILNLMPCVFPILAIKAFGLARLSGGESRTVRAHALSYTAGVVLSFVALAALILVLRGLGQGAGWGFQFTSPIFVALMAWVMLAVGLNLSGVFEIRGAFGFGEDVAGRGGHVGSFATGVLAVVVATPCTAPFMAAALAAAFALPAPATLVIFAAMGLGMASPYALLAVAPGIARTLPRPGAWMERLKQALAFPMYAAAAWLVWVAAQQAGESAVLLVLGGGVLIGFSAWLIGVTQAGSRPGLRLGHVAAVAAFGGALALLPGLSSAPARTDAGREATIEAWSPARVEALRAEGRPVFVNLTAAWCITCKVNERVALKSAAVKSAFADRGVAQLEGDWTSGDAAITDLLRAHGREGVPLYLYFPAGSPRPAILPQILTEGIVLEAIGAARG